MKRKPKSREEYWMDHLGAGVPQRSAAMLAPATSNAAGVTVQLTREKVIEILRYHFVCGQLAEAKRIKAQQRRKKR